MYDSLAIFLLQALTVLTVLVVVIGIPLADILFGGKR
ncbi:hypothetical protein SAMN05877842_11789 [Ureibacillus acetophenoni]|uniref:Uncharacterized protein n=1 Tax=Ureibacillus acetophenoni TaxID=614649 RepID=A0A285UT70_9BACL|nr:hypothetical protein SAMN05877842_11789 [Ureibacillus acetophenoni]